MNFPFHPNTIIAFLLSLVISIYITIVVIRYSLRMGIGDKPGEDRKIHKKSVPNLGGLGVFIGAMVAYFAFSDYHNTIRPDKIFSISILLFFVGMKDDLEPVSVKVRFLLEIACAFFIIYITDIRLLTLWGIFGIHTLPIGASYILSILFIVVCINAYNLIDGIDGLLGVLSLLGVVCFGLIFNYSHQWLWTLLCVSLCGSLFGFLIFNWHKARVFMGNGGALFLGTIFACFSLRLMQQTAPIDFFGLHITAPHTIAFSIVSIPLVDLICVFFYRIIHKKSPFYADNSHIHHRALRLLKFDHAKATLLILAINILIIAFAYWVQGTGALKSILLTFGFALMLDIIVFYIAWRFAKNKTLNE